MKACGWALAVLLVAGGLYGAPPRAASPEKVYAELFGAEDRKVTRTATKVDDIAFARKLLDSAKTLTDDPALRVCLYEKACDFALRHQKGYPAAAEALDRLARCAPARANEWQEKRLELCRLEYRYATGTTAKKRRLAEKLVTQLLIVGDIKAQKDEWAAAAGLFQQAVNTATYVRSPQKDTAEQKLARANLMKQGEDLKGRLRKDPNNRVVRLALIRLYVCDLDDPASAQPYASAATDEVWRTYVPLAAKAPATLAAQVCLELGNWYKSLAESSGVGTTARENLGRRARNYYQLYLGKALGEGVSRGTLEKAREKFNAALKSIGQAALPVQVAFQEPAVQKAFEKAIAYLWGLQQRGGYWSAGRTSSYYGTYYNVRTTSAAVWALLEAGTPVGDPRMVKALRWLEKHHSVYTDGMGLRTMVWRAVERQVPNRSMALLKRDLNTMVMGTTTGGYGLRTNYTYSSSPANSYTWKGHMAVGAGADLKLRIPLKYWRLALQYWAKQQKPDGGWCDRAGSSSRYHGASTPFWTAAGAASVTLALRSLHGEYALRQMSGADSQPLKKALAWLDKNVGPQLVSDRRSSDTGTVPQTLFQVSRVGRLLGRKKFGGTDWFQAGSKYLVANQGAAGGWGGGIEETAFGLVFLTNGGAMQDAGAATVAPVVPPVKTPDAAREAVEKKLRLLKVRLAADPTQFQTAREIVRLYLLELEDPASAAAFVAKTGDPKTVRMIPLAARDLDQLKEGNCLELGDWYRQLATGDSKTARQHALTRAAACYQRFLDVHTTGDAQRLKAKLALGKVRKALEALQKGE
jgi:hypothetical protein